MSNSNSLTAVFFLKYQCNLGARTLLISEQVYTYFFNSNFTRCSSILMSAKKTFSDLLKTNVNFENNNAKQRMCD